MAGPWCGVVAIDGPSGTGKSTVARRLAAALGARYLDTGAMYRAATLAALRAHLAPDDGTGITRLAARSRIEISTEPHDPWVRLDGHAVDAEIRVPEVTAAVSAVSAIAELRQDLVARQQAIIGTGGIVVEGRDISSVVWPSARPKIYLTASAEARARRRARELGAATDVAGVAADIDRRDRFDSSRAASPLTRAPDATVVDTTSLSIEEVVRQLVELVRESRDG